jgi:glycosyltransferase involved in cell wall biosynthesis
MPRALRVLELRSVRGTGGGPEKTIMLGAAQATRDDVVVTVCYIRDRRDRAFRLDERAAALGIEYLEVYERHSFDAAIWPHLRRIVRDRQIDIVHAHDYKTDLLALLLAEFEQTLPLATVHGWTGHNWRERRLYYPGDRWILARYPRLIAVSREIKDCLVKSGARPERIAVVLNGIDPARFVRNPSREPAARAALGWEPGQILIGAVGRLEPQKRFDLLIEAVRTVRDDHPEVRLVIAGDGSLRKDLSDLAARRLPSDACKFVGQIDDVGQFHHGLDLLVQSSDYEGTPNAVLEAMAFETPIVATDVGGTAELVRHDEDGLIVPPGNVRVLADSIRQVLSDQPGARRRVAEARRRVESDLSFASRIRTVERIYRDLAGGSRRNARRSGFLQWA